MAKKGSSRRAEILKKIPNYTKNVAKSTLFSTMDIVKEIAPDVAQFSESTSRITQSAVSQTRQYGSSFTTFFKTYKNSQIYKEVQQAKREAIDDLKSGNFNNKARESSKMDAAMAEDDKKMLGDLGFDFGDSDGELSDEEMIKKIMGGGSSKSSDDKSSAPVINNLSINGNPSGSINAIAQSARMTSNAVLNSSQYVVDNQNAIYTMQTITSQKMFSEVSDRLQEMTGYLKGLFDYTNNISRYYEASTQFYDKSITAFDAMQAYQKELNELTRVIGALNEDEDDKDDTIHHDDVFRGGFDISKYIKNVKQNMSNNTGMVGSLLDSMKMNADTSGKSFASTILESMNPAKMASDAIAKKLFINPIKENLEEFNNVFKSFFKGMNLKGKGLAEGSSNPIYGMLYSLLGVEPDKKEGIEAGVNASKPMKFNSYTDRSITEVMPTYLRKILSAITGGPEMVYDYTSGTFKNVAAVKKNYDREYAYSTDNSKSPYTSHAERVMDAQGIGGKDKKKLGDKFNKFLNFINEEELFFNPHDADYDKLKNKGISSVVDEDEFKYFNNIILSSKDQGLKLNDMVYDTRADHNNFMKAKNSEMFKTGESSLFNGFKDNSGEDNKKGNNTGNVLFKSFTLKDSRGSSIYDYLSDIRDVLMEGIFVYNISTKKNAKTSSMPHERLEAYRARIQNSKSKNAIGNSNSGKDTYGEDYVSPAERSSLANKMAYSPETMSQLIEEKKAKDKKASDSSKTDENSNGNTSEEEKKPGLIKTLTDNIKSITSMPMQFVNTTIKQGTIGMKKLLYGKDSVAFSFLDDLKSKINIKFGEVKSLFEDKIFKPLQEKLFGKDGIMTKFESWFKSTFNNYSDKIKNSLLGSKDDNGAYSGGMLSAFANKGLDSMNAFKRLLTGKGYKSLSTGEDVKDLKGGSILSFITDGFTNMKDKFSEKLFGKVIDTDEDGNKVRDGKGLINYLKDTFINSFDKFKDTYLGKTGINGGDIKQAIPKILSGAGIGGATALWSTMFLPLGIGVIPGLLMGGAVGFAQNNETVQKFLFGDGDKNGVLGGQDLKAKVDKYMPSMMKGFGIGSLAGILTGNPVLGPILGASIGFAVKSDKFKEFLFGKDGDDSKALIKKETIAKMKQVLPKAGLIAGGTFLYKGLGLLGSAVLPGGILGASLFGFASAMALNSESVKRFLFGDIDPETGLRDKNGVIGKVGMWFKYNFIEEVKYTIYNIGNTFKLWFRDKIGNKLQDAFKPMFEELKLAGKKVVKFFGNVISKTFEKSVGMPLGKFMDKLLSPFKKLFGGLLNGIKKAIEMPFAVVGKVGTNLAEKHREQGLSYTDKYFKDKAKRDSSVIKDKEEFAKESADRREKLSLLQRVLSKNGFNNKNEDVKNALNDFDTKYKKGKWKEFEISTYKSINAIEKEGEKQTGLLDNIKDIGNSFLEYIGVKTVNAKNMVKSKLTNAKDKFFNTTSKLKEVKTEAPDIDINQKWFSKVGDKIKSWRVNVKSAVNEGNDKLAEAAENLKKATEEARAHNPGVTDNNPITAKNTPKTKNPAADNISGKYVADAKVKDSPKKKESLVSSINRHVKAIDREIAGQLDGVGWNVDSIRKILVKMSGFDEEGANLKRGNRKRSIFHRLTNMVMRPFDFVKDIAGSIKDRVFGVFDIFKNAVVGGAKAIGGVFKLGASILKTTLSTLGTVIGEGAKVIGTLAVETTRVVGQVLVSSVGALGDLLSGLVKGLGKLGGALLSGIGSLAEGLAKATGAVLSGLGKLAGGLISATGTILKGVAKLSTDIVKTTYKGIKSLVKGLGSVISAPFKAVGKIFGTAKGEKRIAARIINFSDLLMGSKTNPLWVKVANDVRLASGGEDFHISENNPITPKPISPKDGETGKVIDFPGKKEEEIAASNKPEVSVLNKIYNTLSGKKSNNPIESSNENTITKGKNRPVSKPASDNGGTMSLEEARAKLKGNSASIRSTQEKLMSSTADEVNAYADKISNIKDFNFSKASSDISKIKGDKLGAAQAMAQTAAASKGTFAFLAKTSKKGGLLGKLSSLLIFTIPTVMKFFKSLKSGKWIGKLASKLFGKDSIVGKFGSTLLSFLKKGFASIPKTIMSIFKAIGAFLGKFNIGKTIKDKGLSMLSSVKEKGAGIMGAGALSKVPFFKNRKDKSNNNESETKTANPILKRASSVKGLSKKTKAVEAEVKSTSNPILRKAASVKGMSKISPKSTSKKSKLSKGLSLVSDVAHSVVGGPTDQLDMSNIDQSIVINGNVLLQVNGNVVGGGGNGSVSAGGDDSGAGNSLIDAAKDKIEEKVTDKINAKVDKKLGAKVAGKGESKVINLAERRAAKKGAGKAVTEIAEEAGKSGKLTKLAGKLKGKGKLGALGALALGGVSMLDGGSSNGTDDSSVAGTVSSAATSVAQGVGTNVANNAFKQAVTGRGAETALTAVGETAANGASKSGIISKISGLVKKICDGPLKSMFGKYANILPQVGDWVVSKLAKVGLNKLPGVLARLTERAVGGAATLGIVPVALAAYDGVSGMFEARRIFKLSPNDPVTMGMRVATGLAKAVSNNLTFGLIDSGDIANFIYGLVASKDDKAQLEQKQNSFQEQYNAYVQDAQSKGEEVQDFDTWNKGKNKSFLGQAKDGIVGGVKAVGNAIVHPIDTVKKAGKWVGEKTAQAGNWIGNTASNIGNSVKNFVSNPIDSIKNGASAVWNTGKNMVSSVGNGISTVANGVGNVVSGVGKVASNIGGALLDNAPGLIRTGLTAFGLSKLFGGKRKGQTAEGGDATASDTKGGIGGTVAGIASTLTGDGSQTQSSGPINNIQGMLGGNGANSVVISGNATIQVQGSLNGGFGQARAPRGTYAATQADNDDTKLNLTGEKVDLKDIGKNLSNDVGLLGSNGKNMSLNKQFGLIDEVQKKSGKLIEKAGASAQLTMAKANDAIKNTASSYSTLAGTTMNSTLNMASTNSTNNASSYAVSNSNGQAAVPVGTPPAQVQSSSNSLWSTVKNVASSVASGVSKLFGFGGFGGDDEDCPTCMPQTQTGKPVIKGGFSGSPAPATQQAPTGGDVVNGMVYFNQNEEPWASMPYNGPGQSKETIHSSGCGPTSAAMVLSSITGKMVTPKDTSEWSVKNGFRVPGIGTDWGFFPAIGKQYGIDIKNNGKDMKSLTASLAQHKPAILSGQGGAPFTKSGHFVVAAGLDNSGNIIINDPNHRYNNKAFSPQQIQSAGLMNSWTTDKSISGNLPQGTGVSGGTPGAPGAPGAAPQAESNNPLDIMSKIGSTLSDALGSIIMGKVYTPNAPAPGADGAAPGAAGVTGSGTFSGAMGSLPLPAGVTKWKSVFDQYGAQYGVEPAVMEAISAQESGGDANSYNGAALGLMQIENTLASEFADFGKKTAGQAYTLADRADPNKAIPFATYRFSSDMKHYGGDYMKTIQAYNFSKYSLDMLIKKYGNDWMSHRKEMGQVNGTGIKNYGDAEYVEHVLRYYYGTAIKKAGGNGGFGDISDEQIRKMPMGDLRNMAMNAVSPKGGFGGDNTPIITPSKNKQVDFKTGTGTNTKIVSTDSIKIPPKPVEPDHVQVDKFATTSMKSMTNNIDNMLFAQDAYDNNKNGGMNVSAIIGVLNKISANTEETAGNTKAIANKDFSVTHQYNNNYENTQNIDSSSKNVSLHQPGNAFVDMANENNHPTSGYEYASAIASK